MRRHHSILALVLATVLGAVSARVSQAQWQVNGVPVCTPADGQTLPGIISDGAGGAIITWEDSPSRASPIVYAQRLNAAGVPQWTTCGVALCTNGALPEIASDGAGGAIVTWEDYRSTTSVYAQRVDAAGVPQWTPDGVLLCTGAGSPEIASDGAGGAIVIWACCAVGPIFAQRVSAAGAPQWTANGIALCPGPDAHWNGPHDQPTIVPDGAGGAIVTWQDYRNGLGDIYAQRVNAEGVPQWVTDGVALCTAVGTQDSPTIASDGAGGAIVTWMDGRMPTDPDDIYAQRVSADGAPLWTADGVALCAAAYDQQYPTITADAAGGAIVTWQDRRSGTVRLDMYAQRVSATGAPQWATDGVALGLFVDSGNTPVFPTIASDGAGGAVVTSVDSRSGTLDVRAQRVDQAGVPQWTTDGVVLCTNTNEVQPKIVSDGAGGAIVSWTDGRNGYSDIYAQRVYGSGGVVAVSPPGAPARFQVLAPSPNPTRDGRLTIRFNLPSSARVSAEVLDVAGHRVRTLATDREYSPGTQALGWDGRDDAGVGLSSGVYFVEVREGTHSEARRAVLLH